MIENICHYSSVFDIQSRIGETTEVVIVKKHDEWSEFFFDEKKDIDEFINHLIRVRDMTFK
jgi:hypothetical protein